MDDKFQGYETGLSSPFEHMTQFVPSDDPADDLAQPTRCIYSGGTGNISFVTMHDEIVTMKVSKGLVMPIRVVRVRSTGTTVTSVIGLW